VLTFLRHRKTIEGRRDGSGRAGNVHQDSRHRTAEAGAGVDRGEKDHRRQELHIERHRQRQRHRHGDRHARKRPEHEPDEESRHNPDPRIPRGGENLDGTHEGLQVDHRSGPFRRCLQVEGLMGASALRERLWASGKSRAPAANR
jgi:hypothetical protein